MVVTEIKQACISGTATIRKHILRTQLSRWEKKGNFFFGGVGWGGVGWDGMGWIESITFNK